MRDRTVQNNVRATGGITGKGFTPGRSGNPGGRPKGLMSFIRAQTGDGRDLVDRMLAISRGETVCGKRPRIVDIMDAIKWLADRGWGKAVQPQEMTGDDGGPVTVILRRDRDF